MVLQCQAMAGRDLMAADAALGQGKEIRSLILPQFQQAALPLRARSPDAPAGSGHHVPMAVVGEPTSCCSTGNTIV